MKTPRKKRFLFVLIGCILCMNSAASINASTISSTVSTTTLCATKEANTKKSSKTEDDYWPKGPSVTASSAIVMEASTGLILYEKNMNEQHYPASITKIMTSLIAIENSSLSDVVTFSKDAIFNVDLDSSRIGIDVGEELTVEQCLYGILLSSANEVSYGVAEHVGGNVDNFVDMMNQRAKELGCLNTHFANPHGLHDDNHYTSAYDMALIAQTAIKNTTFAKITGSRTYMIPPTNIQDESRPLANHHKFIKKDIHYDGCIGGKTGYTPKARYTLVTYAKRGDMELISVVMESETAASQYTDTASLLDYGFDNFFISKISSIDNSNTLEESPFFTKYSSVLDRSNSWLSTDQDGYIVLPNTVNYTSAKKSIHFEPIDTLVEGDNIIGSITYTYNQKVVGKTNIIYRNVPSKKLPSNDTSTIEDYISTEDKEKTGDDIKHSKRNLKPMIIVVIIVIIIVLGILYYVFIERPHRRRKRAYYKRRERRHQQYHDDFFNL